MGNIDFEDYNLEDHYEGRYKEKYQFMMIGYNIVKKNKLKNSIRLYLFLRRYIRKIKSEKDILDIFTKYYAERGLLACSWSFETIAKKLDVTERTIRRWIDELKTAGAIRIERIRIPVSQKLQNVYILGEKNEDYEIYYYEKENTNG